MTYSKTTWADEVLSGDERYDITEDNGDPYKATMQIALATAVSIAGTAVNATNLNKLEAGVEQASVATRQGGDPTDWDVAGTTTYTPASQLIQVGNKAPASNGTFTVTFPTAFSAKPIVLCQGDYDYDFVTVTAASTTQFSGVVYIIQGTTPFSLEAGTAANTFNWIAIGPA